jgi:hypothetical protein
MKRSAQGFFAAVVLLLSVTVLMRNAPAAMAVSDVPRVAVAAVDSYGEYTALTPARVFDTRDGTGQFGVAAALTGGISRDVQITGQGGVPATNVSSVVMNVTVTNPTRNGWLRVWPSGTQEPSASNLNFVAGQTVPNLVTVQLGGNGSVSVSTLSGSVEVIFDVVGLYSTETGVPGGRFHATTPARLLDTRNGAGLALGQGSVVGLQVSGVGGVPATGVIGVAVNVTVTEPTSSGFLTVWPSDVALPLASNLNFVAGLTIPNLVVVRVPMNGVINFFNSAGSLHLIVDVVGWYDQDRTTEAGRFIPMEPWRGFDTRVDPFGPLFPHEALQLWFNDAGVSWTGWLGSVVLNVTVTATTATGFMTVYPGNQAVPLASSLNFVPGQTVPNLVMVAMSSEGDVEFYNSAGNTHVVVDCFGAFTNERALPVPMAASALTPPQG